MYCSLKYSDNNMCLSVNLSNILFMVTLTLKRPQNTRKGSTLALLPSQHPYFDACYIMLHEIPIFHRRVEYRPNKL